MKQLLVIANPVSGRGRSLKKAESFMASASDSGILCTLVYRRGETAMLEEVETLLATDEFSGVIVVGGDGLLHTLLPTLKQNRLPFTIIPAGTGNDFAREIKAMKRSAGELLDQIKSAPHFVDTFLVNGEISENIGIQVLSLGFDALVNERANKMKVIKGKSKYVVAMIRELPIFKPMRFDLEIDGTSIEREAMLIAIANGSSYGGGMRICPDADHGDGELDILILNKVSILELIKVFPKVYFGKHISHPAVEILRGRNLRVNAPAKAFADGEFISELPVSISVAPASLQVWR